MYWPCHSLRLLTRQNGWRIIAVVGCMRRQPYADLQQQYGNVAIKITIPTITGTVWVPPGPSIWNIPSVRRVMYSFDSQKRARNQVTWYFLRRLNICASVVHVECTICHLLQAFPYVVLVQDHSGKQSDSLLSFMMNRRYTALLLTVR